MRVISKQETAMINAGWCPGCFIYYLTTIMGGSSAVVGLSYGDLAFFLSVISLPAYIHLIEKITE